MKSLIKKLIAPVILATGLLFSPVKANPTSSTKKINSPEYAEEVRTGPAGYKHWRFGDVWYSNTPLKEYSEDKIKSLSKTSTDYEDIRMDPFTQPNDSNLVWYGSGDVDSNNVQDWNDHNLIQQGIQNDQADIDGDGISGTQEDAELFAKYLNGDTLLPQINWAWPNMTRESRKNWAKKMLVIDKTNEIPPVQGEWMCGQYSTQTIINFHGFSELKDSTIASKFPKYNLDNLGKVNIPVYQVGISWGEPIGHFINAILIGDNPLNFEDLYFFDVSRNDKEVVPGDVLMPENCEVDINSSFFSENGGISTYAFAKFILNNGVPSLDGDPSKYLLLERPYVNFVKPEKLNLLEKYVLNQNYPNPFNSNTTINYSLPFDDKVTLNIYNLKGNLVETLVNEKQRQGEYTIPLNASNLSSGIYLFNLQTSAGSQTKKMSVLK